ncbi:MAG: GIY-YIG nuclease family protein [Porphyromonadaceae bacterium]|nr:MAG: GIY-YIG nuclease family protein [Porphyromonadaceae bacterium]
MKTKLFFVYIMASENNRILYVRITNDIQRRVREHQEHLNQGFNWKYNVSKLVYFESFDFVEDAILREKQLKKWNREWKDNLIKKSNPLWNDLTPTL